MRKKRKVVGYRSSVTGEWVSKEFAEANPETTQAVTEIEVAEESESDKEEDGEATV